MFGTVLQSAVRMLCSNMTVVLLTRRIHRRSRVRTDQGSYRDGERASVPWL